MGISLCMIVKNEEKNIAKCLNAVKAIADEVIIIDTGSTDRTKEIAKSFNASIFDFKWQDDFSKARNLSLSKATKEWILILDADEVIANGDLAKIGELTRTKEHLGYLFLTKNYTNNTSIAGFIPSKGKETENFLGWFPSYKVRLFPNKKGILFEGVVHELVDNSIIKTKGKIVKADIPIHHYQLDYKEKQGLYLELAKKKAALEPGSVRAHYELAIQYKELGKFDEAIASFKKSIEIGPDYMPSLYNIGVVYEKSKDYDKAIEAYNKCIAINKSYSNAYFGLGVCYLRKNMLSEAIKFFIMTIKLNPLNIAAYNNLGALYEKIGDYKKAIAALKDSIMIKETKKGFFNLAVAYDKHRDYEEAVAAYTKAAELGHEKSSEIKKRIGEIKNMLKSGSTVSYSTSLGVR